MCGCVLLATGFGLGLLFGTFDVQVEGPAGIAVAILFGTGLCGLLLAAVGRVLPRTMSPQNNDDKASKERQLRDLAESYLHLTKLTLFFSAASTIAAFALFLGGIPVAFIGFNFASGTNDFGLIMMFTGIVVGVIAILSSLFGIPVGWISWSVSGKSNWFFVVLALPIVQTVSFLVVWYFAQ